MGKFIGETAPCRAFPARHYVVYIVAESVILVLAFKLQKRRLTVAERIELGKEPVLICLARIDELAPQVVLAVIHIESTGDFDKARKGDILRILLPYPEA